MKLTREQKTKVEVLALRLYDQRNPEPFKVINVSKQKCIDDAMARLGYSKR